MCDNYSTVVYQMGHATEDMAELSQRTVVDPMKKLSGEFPSIQVRVQVPKHPGEGVSSLASR